MIRLDTIFQDLDAILHRFVMEHLDGDNLETVVRDPDRGPCSDVECIKAARNVLSALKVADRAGHDGAMCERARAYVHACVHLYVYVRVRACVRACARVCIC
jgi:hypothetical protein